MSQNFGVTLFGGTPRFRCASVSTEGKVGRLIQSIALLKLDWSLKPTKFYHNCVRAING